MRFAAFAIVLFSGSLMLAQSPKATMSRHASVGQHSASLGTAAITPNTSTTATQLSKIEQQHVAYQSQQARQSSVPAPAKTTPPGQNNKPIKFAYHPPANNNASH